MNNPRISSKESEAIGHIRNSIVHEGRFPSIRRLMVLMGYKSPRSTALIIKQLMYKGLLQKRQSGAPLLVEEISTWAEDTQTISVPLLGTVACGGPIFAVQNIEAMVPVSVGLAKPPNKYFLLRAKGDSMNAKGINDGDLVLVRNQSTAINGENVVALINDDATIKEYRRAKEVVVLQPRSTNPEYQPIILTEDFKIQGVVVAVVPNLSKNKEVIDQ